MFSTEPQYRNLFKPEEKELPCCSNPRGVFVVSEKISELLRCSFVVMGKPGFFSFKFR
jgi:hypothetical protein